MKKSSLWLQVGILLAAWLGIVIRNYPYGTSLIGWDNLLPELNFPENAWRAVFGVWQAHQGLGHIGGHGYAATLPHTLFLWFLSVFLPLTSLRPIFTFLMLLAGSLGAFSLARHLLKNSVALVAGLFYMLNLATVQNFYIELEAFIVHFALLPWLVLTLLAYLEHPSRKTFFWFAVANVFAIPMGFIPPLFLVYLLVVGIILVGKNLRAILVVAGTIFAVHAFWLLPVTHFSLTESKNYLNSYSNIMTTQDFISQNKNYGNLGNVALLKGFYFESLDTRELGVPFKILGPWENHLASPWIRAIGYALFGLVVLGVVTSLFDKKNRYKRLTVVFLVSFVALGTNIPIAREISSFLEAHVPIFNQAFRITFTKFSINLSLWYAVYLAYGVRKISPLWVIVGASIVVFSWPSFRGDFLYRGARIQLPQAYTELIEFFKTQPKDERIANFTQGWRTGWSIYNWGYSGSGFLWYGITQPILDRAFDVWSPYNENYFWQASDAIYSGEFWRFERLLDTYDIVWILFDPNARPYQTIKEPLYSEFFHDYLRKSTKVSLEKTFFSLQPKILPLELYRVHHPSDVSPVSLFSDLRNVGPPYRYSDRDEPGKGGEVYMTDSREAFDLLYPFRSLFTGRSAMEKEFELEEQDTSLVFRSKDPIPAGTLLHLPPYAATEAFMPAQITLGPKHFLEMKLLEPTIRLGSHPFGSTESGKTVLSLPLSDETKLIVNGASAISIPQDLPSFVILSLQNINIFDLSNPARHRKTTISNAESKISLTSQDIRVAGTDSIEVEVPKVIRDAGYDSAIDPQFGNIDEHRCDPATPRNPNQQIFDRDHWTLRTKNAIACMGWYFPALSQRMGYLLKIRSRNIEGKPALVQVINKETKRPDVAVYTKKSSNWSDTYFVLPPQIDSGLGYSIKIINESLGTDPTTNDLAQVALWPIPYNFLKNISSQQRLGASKNTTFVLSQAYDPGWMAFKKTSAFPYYAPIGKHVLINNWANGWKLEGNEGPIVVFFMPQLLEWIGFGLLTIPFLLALKKNAL